MTDPNRLKVYDNVIIHESKGGQYALKIKENGKTKACAYVSSDHKKEYHKVYRVFVEETDRGHGYGKMIMDAVINNFGDLDLYLSAYPNRISTMTKENKQEYIEKLFKFYERFGFVKNNKTNNMYRTSSTKTDISDIFE